MLHPVGPLPAAVYWRRRLIVLVVVLGALGGAGWLGCTLLSRGSDSASAAAGGSRTALATPALEKVVPSLGSVATPSPVSGSATAPAPAPPAPPAGGPCSDDMIRVEVRAPAAVARGSKPTFELVVTNGSPVPCVRVLDKGLQELVLADLAGNRVWGSNDCFPEASSDTRTLAPGEAVAFPLVWGGLTSEPTCTVARTTPAAGDYVLRGRLDTKVSPDTPVHLD